MKAAQFSTSPSQTQPAILLQHAEPRTVVSVRAAVLAPLPPTSLEGTSYAVQFEYIVCSSPRLASPSFLAVPALSLSFTASYILDIGRSTRRSHITVARITDAQPTTGSEDCARVRATNADSAAGTREARSNAKQV